MHLAYVKHCIVVFFLAKGNVHDIDDYFFILLWELLRAVYSALILLF